MSTINKTKTNKKKGSEAWVMEWDLKQLNS